MRDAVNLDFLRSVAVLLVVHAHWTVYTGRAGQDGWSGITGVCMFFVHTSLVLMWSLERDPRVGHFYVRRAFRLYPLWLVVLAIVLLFHLPQSPEFHFRMPGLREILFNAALLCNLRFGPNLVGASWTLPIEVQMYLFLPFLFFFARATRALWPLLVIDLFVMFYDRTNFPSFYSALPMCIPYFLPGIMGFVLSKRGGLKVLPGWAFPIFLFLIVLFDRYHGSFRMSWWFCLVLGLAIPLFHDMRAAPVRVISHYLAKYSYGIYLTHTIAIVVAVYLLRGHSTAVRIGAFWTLLCSLPVLFYHLIEEPMIRYGSKLAGRLDRHRTPPVTESTLQMEPAP